MVSNDLPKFKLGVKQGFSRLSVTKKVDYSVEEGKRN
jgi:hypothetical protein